MEASTSPTQGSPSVDKHKALAIIGYILPILFFLPFLMEEGKKSAFARFHANQQLNLLLFGVVGQIAAMVLTAVVIGVFLFPIVVIASLVFMIMGIINAANGNMKPLPLIGGFTLIK